MVGSKVFKTSFNKINLIKYFFYLVTTKTKQNSFHGFHISDVKENLINHLQQAMNNLVIPVKLIN